MKKYFLFAAVAGMLASCSSESLTAGSDPKIEPTQEERVPIEINVASVQTKASTRGSGAVGDLVGDANNVWKGQIINAFMFDKNKLTIPRDEEGDIYNDTELSGAIMLMMLMQQQLLLILQMLLMLQVQLLQRLLMVIRM